MIESTSSWTKASGSNSNVFTAKETASARKPAPGRSACAVSHVSRRPAIPCDAGIPARPAACSITRRLSTTANWPRRKKLSRGVVAIQFGLPRPALRNADCVVFDVFLASVISSSLISNGLSFSKLRSFTRSMACLLISSRDVTTAA